MLDRDAGSRLDDFDPMRKQVEVWQRSELKDVTAKVVIYEAFVEGKLEVPKHLAGTVHDLYFDRSTKTSGHVQSGASPTRSPQRSRSSIPSRNSGRQPNWASSSKQHLSEVICHESTLMTPVQVRCTSRISAGARKSLGWQRDEAWFLCCMVGSKSGL